MKPIKFVLCAYIISYMIISFSAHRMSLVQTPPKRELRVSDLKVRDQTLLQLQLAPTAILHLKFEDESLNRAFASHIMRSFG